VDGGKGGREGRPVCVFVFVVCVCVCFLCGCVDVGDVSVCRVCVNQIQC
jgi:hypothetical protein